MWNMQSGKERRSFALSGVAPVSKAKIIGSSKFAKPQDAEKAKAKAPIRSTKAITGLVTDALNTVVVASTLEGKLYVGTGRSESEQRLIAVLRLPQYQASARDAAPVFDHPDGLEQG